MSGFRRAALLCTAVAALTLPASAFAAPAPAGWWKLDDGTGTTAADAAGAHPATLRGGAGWTAGIVGPSALSTNGSSAFADTGDPVIDTSHSFSVSAWVRLTRISGFQTVVSVDGTQVSGFYFGLRDDTRRFAFVKLPSDVPQGGVIVSGTFDPVPNRWYLLTGVFDATANTMSLYVDGRLQGTSPAPATAWRAAGTLAIGRARYNGGNVDFVSGAIDDVRVWQDVLTPDDVAQLADAGSWRLDEGSGTTAADASGNHNDLTLTAGASWTQGVVGSSALLFNGTSGAAEAPGPVLDTSQGFSVAAWVRSDAATGFRTAVSVDGQQISSFFLQQRSDNHFAFTRIATDAPGTGIAAVQTATIRQGQWYHLVGVYDSAANTLALYVNGTLQQTVAAPTGWKASGHLVVGRGKYAGAPTDFFSGAVDDVRTFSFPIGAAAASALATSGAWHFDEGAGTVARDDSPEPRERHAHQRDLDDRRRRPGRRLQRRRQGRHGRRAVAGPRHRLAVAQRLVQDVGGERDDPRQGRVPPQPRRRSRARARGYDRRRHHRRRLRRRPLPPGACSRSTAEPSARRSTSTARPRTSRPRPARAAHRPGATPSTSRPARVPRATATSRSPSARGSPARSTRCSSTASR